MTESPDEIWRPREWLAKAKCSNTFLWELPPELAPKSVKVGRARFITESPKSWAERLAAATVQPEQAA